MYSVKQFIIVKLRSRSFSYLNLFCQSSKKTIADNMIQMHHHHPPLTF